MNRITMAALLFAMTACAEEDHKDTGPGQTTGGDPGADTESDAPSDDSLAIVGSYFLWQDLMDITESSVKIVRADPNGGYRRSNFHVRQYDNEEMWLITESYANNTVDYYGTDTWWRFDWAWEGTDLYICNLDGSASQEEALAVSRPDDSDVANSGCGPYPWAPLTPTY